ncbi:polysaccharide biosynthesis/export family protein [Solidesulfovibrio sp.]|uniref:polysaccharide biosynthesis/export family protein n=1 Tax=Solidesulfovibrio sp. TaxID=2910990 RepID=UPI0026077CA6|nr:polysaccharide biosynthesis/export family protein [Solidesulfovibrio sp.]
MLRKICSGVMGPWCSADKNQFMAMVLFTFLTLVPFAAQAKDYTFTAGDKIHISVAGEPEFSGDATVRPDGKLAVPNGGEVQAVGMTAAQLQAEVTDRVKEYILKPTVNISVVGSGNNKVFVTGGGVKPAVVDITQHATLLNLLTSLGDISGADLRTASVVRDGRDIKKDFHDLIVGSDVSQDIPLMAGDTILLPPTASNRGVYVVGAVNVPKLVVYREGMTLLEAILDAGGFSKFASPNDTRIIRTTEGNGQIIKVQAKKLIRDGDLTQNVVLRGGDLVIVDESFF